MKKKEALPPAKEWSFLVPDENFLLQELRKKLWIPEEQIDRAYHYEYARQIYKDGWIDKRWAGWREYSELTKKPFIDLSTDEISRFFGDQYRLGTSYGRTVHYAPPDIAKAFFSSGDREEAEKFMAFPLVIQLDRGKTEITKDFEKFVEEMQNKLGIKPLKDSGKTDSRTMLRFLGALRLERVLQKDVEEAFAEIKKILDKSFVAEDIFSKDARNKAKDTPEKKFARAKATFKKNADNARLHKKKITDEAKKMPGNMSRWF